MQNSCPTRIKLRWWSWVVLALVLSLILLLDFRSPAPKVVILPSQEPAPGPVQRLVELGWSWLQFHLPGRRESILLRAQVLRFALQPNSKQLSLNPATAATNGVQVWVLERPDALRLNQTLQQFPGAEVLAQPGIQTLSGIRGSIAAGNTVVVDGKPKWVGVELNTLPKLRPKQIDLIWRLELTDPVTNHLNQLLVRTNVAIRARIQIPIGGGMFLLEDQGNGKTMAVLLSATLQ